MRRFHVTALILAGFFCTVIKIACCFALKCLYSHINKLKVAIDFLSSLLDALFYFRSPTLKLGNFCFEVACSLLIICESSLSLRSLEKHVEKLLYLMQAIHTSLTGLGIRRWVDIYGILVSVRSSHGLIKARYEVG